MRPTSNGQRRAASAIPVLLLLLLHVLCAALPTMAVETWTSSDSLGTVNKTFLTPLPATYAGNNITRNKLEETDAGVLPAANERTRRSDAVAGYVAIFSNYYAFAALKADGTVAAWGRSDSGGSGAPTGKGKGYVAIFSNGQAFAAMKADGSLAVWGDSSWGGSGAPHDNRKGYVAIFSNHYAFAALKADGSIAAWGSSWGGGSGAPTDKGYVAIFSTHYAFAALKADGSIAAWGQGYGGSGAPTGKGAFAATKADGTVYSWGHGSHGSTGAPTTLPVGSTFGLVCGETYPYTCRYVDQGASSASEDTDSGHNGSNVALYVCISIIAVLFAGIVAIGLWRRGGREAENGKRAVLHGQTITTATNPTYNGPVPVAAFGGDAMHEEAYEDMNVPAAKRSATNNFYDAGVEQSAGDATYEDVVGNLNSHSGRGDAVVNASYEDVANIDADLEC
eukprot:gene20251-14977_t